MVSVCEDTFTSFQGQDVRNTVDTCHTLIGKTEKRRKKATDVSFIQHN